MANTFGHLLCKNASHNCMETTSYAPPVIISMYNTQRSCLYIYVAHISACVYALSSYLLSVTLKSHCHFEYLPDNSKSFLCSGVKFLPQCVGLNFFTFFYAAFIFDAFSLESFCLCFFYGSECLTFPEITKSHICLWETGLVSHLQETLVLNSCIQSVCSLTMVVAMYTKFHIFCSNLGHPVKKQSAAEFPVILKPRLAVNYQVSSKRVEGGGLESAVKKLKRNVQDHVMGHAGLRTG